MARGLLIFLNGISGVGKTTTFHRLKARFAASGYYFVHLDEQEQTPQTNEEIVRQAGSAENWQQLFIDRQIGQAVDVLTESKRWVIVMDGQSDFSFIEETCRRYDLAHHIILLVAPWATVAHRLVEERKQPELANESMQGWSSFLLAQAQARRTPLVNTLASPQVVEETVAHLIQEMTLTVELARRPA